MVDVDETPVKSYARSATGTLLIYMIMALVNVVCYNIQIYYSNYAA